MKISPLPNRKYVIIYADPPWKYSNENTGWNMKSGASSKYPTLSLDEIAGIKVKDISLSDSVCFLWITTPLLNLGFEVLKAWDFEYKTAIFWRKIMSPGMGFWFRGQVEVCLLGTKGRIKPFRIQKSNFIQTRVEEHSKKPSEMYRLIEEINLSPRIELFARNTRKGWDCWGLEANKVGDDGKLRTIAEVFS